MGGIGVYDLSHVVEVGAEPVVAIGALACLGGAADCQGQGGAVAGCRCQCYCGQQVTLSRECMWARPASGLWWREDDGLERSYEMLEACRCVNAE